MPWNTPLVDIYPVGVFAALIRLRRALRTRRAWLIGWALKKVGWELRHVLRHLLARDWRTARNSIGGYLAEHRTRGHRCGRGWTRRRALRDLYRHLAECEKNEGGRPDPPGRPPMIPPCAGS